MTRQTKQNAEIAHVGIVDNDPLVARALESMFIESHAPVNIMWTVPDAERCVELCLLTGTTPDVLLLDIQMPQKDGKQVAEDLRLRGFKGKILAMTAFRLAYSNQELTEAGIDSLIRKEAELQEYVQTMGDLLHNERLTSWQEHSLAYSRMMLTDTELSVLKAFLKGNTTQATAHMLHMSVGTVKTHMRSAYRKMGVHCRAEAIRVLVHEHEL